MIHDTKRVEAIRRRVAVKVETLAKMESAVKDSTFREQIELPKDWLNDIETLYLSDLSRQQRTPSEESWWLEQAERMLGIAEQQCTVLESAFKKYGPNLRIIG